MSKTQFLPLKSSQSTEGDRHRNKTANQSAWHVYRSSRGGLQRAQTPRRE